jgi:hypothetical protein
MSEESKPQELRESLKRTFEQAADKASRAVEWYYRARRPLQLSTRWFPFGAILLAVAGLLGLAGHIFYHSPAKSGLYPFWSVSLLVVAPVLFLLPWITGARSGNRNYLLAAQRLNQALDQFQLDYQTATIHWGKEGPSQAQAEVFLARCQEFVGYVNEIVQQETQEWADKSDQQRSILRPMVVPRQSPQRVATSTPSRFDVF